MENFHIGADPELFLKRKEKYIAVQPFVDGTKDKPQPLPSGGNAQRDNVAIEFGIVPAKTKAEFLANIGTTLQELKNLLPNDIDLDATPSARFEEDELQHEECQQFGCSPDFNAWTNRVNIPPVNAAKDILRACGGHIHIELRFIKDDDHRTRLFVKLLDIFLGTVSIIIDNNNESIERRTLYGRAGCYRPTSYGVEYRTLSNYWVKHPLLTELQFMLVKDAIDIMLSGDGEDFLAYVDPNLIQHCINTGDIKLAYRIVDRIRTAMSEKTQELFAKCTHKNFRRIFDNNILDSWKDVINETA